jgi:phytoene desaturase
MSSPAGTAAPDFDVIVVGCGLGGLSAAALLARAGVRVLAVERQDGPGGCAQAFRRGPYLFDPAVHFTQEGRQGRFLDLLLDHLDVRDDVELVAIPTAYGARFPGLGITVPAGGEAALAAHIDACPGDAAGLSRYFDTLAAFNVEATHIGMQLGLRDLDDAVEQFPTFFRYRRATLADVLDDHLDDPRTQQLCAAMWPYLGLPPSRLSFYAFQQFFNVIVEQGTFYCRGSFQRLADALAHVVRRDGGDLRFGTAVTAIEVTGGHVRGVRLDDGERVTAPVVISNADPHRTFTDLLDPDLLPRRLHRRLARMEPSVSAFVLYAATALDVSRLAVGHETFLHDDWDHEATYRGVLAGDPGGVWVNVPTLADPRLAPPGEHLVIVTALAPHAVDGGWPAARDRWTDALLARVERMLLPGLTASLAHLEAATPLALERHIGSHRGAIYGAAVTPDQTGSKRLAHTTPIEGLYLSGAWTHEGPGSFRVLLSGFMTARLVLRALGLDDRVPDLRPADLPRLGSTPS